MISGYFRSRADFPVFHKYRLIRFWSNLRPWDFGDLGINTSRLLWLPQIPGCFRSRAFSELGILISGDSLFLGLLTSGASHFWGFLFLGLLISGASYFWGFSFLGLLISGAVLDVGLDILNSLLTLTGYHGSGATLELEHLIQPHQKTSPQKLKKSKKNKLSQNLLVFDYQPFLRALNQFKHVLGSRNACIMV